MTNASRDLQPSNKNSLNLIVGIRLLEWNYCLFFSPKGARAKSCALQYASKS